MIIQAKVAIIIPCWNCENEIKEMLDSIINQTFHDWVVFCIDDLSTDNTSKVLEFYSKKNKRINYITRSYLPKGAQTCRNIGLDYSSKAEYVVFFDADDLIAPYCLEQRVNYMDTHPELDFSIFPAKTFINDIWDMGSGYCYGYPIFEDSLEAMLNWTLPMVGWTNIYRRLSLIKHNIRWDTNILSMQDSDFNIQCLINGLHFDYAFKNGAKVDYFYRIDNNPNATSKKIHQSEHFHSHLYYLNKISNSLSIEQKKIYNQNLIDYYFRFASIIKSNLHSYITLLHFPWIRKNFVFFIKLYVWMLFNFRFEKYLFHFTQRRIFMRNQGWKRSMKEYLKSNSKQNG